MKKTPNTENQVVTHIKVMDSATSALIRENRLLRDTICKITGQIEGEAEYAFEKNNLKTAEGLYRQLIIMHNRNPLGRVSKLWNAEWRSKLTTIYDMIDEACQGIEAYPSR